MLKKPFILFVLCAFLFNCKSDSKKQTIPSNISEVVVTGQMKDVMWEGELFGKIKLDTLQSSGLYGLGPEAYLTGEIIINDGKIYTSKVLSDSTMHVEKSKNVKAPFFVHSIVKKWEAFKLPNSIMTISDIEKHITELTKHVDKPFAFKLDGNVKSAEIHIQNLPKGTKVSSPKEAHQGQVNYNIYNENVTLIGFYSKNHKGIFTHHDTNLHIHLITADETKMGHLDAINANSLTLHLPLEVAKTLKK